VGGIEHAAMHLLYARFITKALRDMGYLSFDEPFKPLIHQGIILGSDGQKMSRRNGAVAPDVYIEQYGSDAFRMYLGFGFSYREGGPWNDEGIKAISKFLSKVGRIAESCLNSGKSENKNEADGDLEYIRNYTIKEVAKDYDNFEFNTAIARIMEYANAVLKYQAGDNRCFNYEKDVIKDLILLLAPMAPHFTEELWEAMGFEYSVHNQKFPEYNEQKLVKKAVSIAVQINGAVKKVISVPSPIDDEELKEFVLKEQKIADAVNGREIKKVIIVKDRIINFVI
jgi:leucyl-tRNA synthetase